MIRKLSCFFLILALVLPPFSVYGQDKVIVPILLYHCIEENFTEDISNVAITKDTFTIHMQTLKDAGYTPISFDEYYQFVEHGKPLPQKPIMITFDDGYLSNYLVAYPILKDLGFKATIFIVASSVGKSNTADINYPHFTWGQAKEMVQSGVIEIGSHTFFHRDMRAYSKDKIQTDLRLSKYLIDDNLNINCDLLAYPYGYYTPEIQELATKAGYKMQCIVGDVGANTLASPMNQLKRLTISGYYSAEKLLEVIDVNTRLEQ